MEKEKADKLRAIRVWIDWKSSQDPKPILYSLNLRPPNQTYNPKEIAVIRDYAVLPKDFKVSAQDLENPRRGDTVELMCGTKVLIKKVIMRGEEGWRKR